MLRDHYRVLAAGFTDPDCDVEWCPIDGSGRSTLEKIIGVALLKTGFYERFYNSSKSVRSLRTAWNKRNADGHVDIDLVIANDVHALPVALEIAQDRPVILDAHEYGPEVQSDFVWKFLMAGYENWLCRTYLKRARLMTTVAHVIARKYEETFGVKSLVVFNAPYRQKIKASQVKKGAIRLVHHGIAIRDRGLEEMIALFDHLDDRFSLDFYLMESNASMSAYVNGLKQKAHKHGSRIRFNQPVRMQDLPRELSRYDIGLQFVRPTNFNNASSMPNKFFEFVQARLAIASGPTVEVSGLIEKYSMGVVSPTFDSVDMAKVLTRLTEEEVSQMKCNADKAADSLCYESTSAPFLDSIRRILGEEHAEVNN